MNGDIVLWGPAVQLLLFIVDNGPVTCGAIKQAMPMPHSTLWNRLYKLRALGLITWEPGTKGTIRSTLIETPFGEAA